MCFASVTATSDIPALIARPHPVPFLRSCVLGGTKWGPIAQLESRFRLCRTSHTPQCMRTPLTCSSANQRYHHLQHGTGPHYFHHCVIGFPRHRGGGGGSQIGRLGCLHFSVRLPRHGWVKMWFIKELIRRLVHFFSPTCNFSIKFQGERHN